MKRFLKLLHFLKGFWYREEELFDKDCQIQGPIIKVLQRYLKRIPPHTHKLTRINIHPSVITISNEHYELKINRKVMNLNKFKNGNASYFFYKKKIEKNMWKKLIGKKQNITHSQDVIQILEHMFRFMIRMEKRAWCVVARRKIDILFDCGVFYIELYTSHASVLETKWFRLPLSYCRTKTNFALFIFSFKEVSTLC